MIPARATWAALLCLLALLATPAAAQTFPKFTGLVVDAANVLPPDMEASLTQKLQDLQRQTGRQLVVATIPDTQGRSIEDYGYRLGRTWGVGLKDADNGAILFVAPGNPRGQRGPRIEVGRRLEPVLTDALASVIINTRMMPRLRENNDVAGAMTAGTDALVEQLMLPDAEAKARLDAATAAFDRTHRRSSSENAGGNGFPVSLIFWGVVLAFVLLGMARGGTARGGRRYRHVRSGGSNLPIILWGLSELTRGSGGGSGWGGGGGGFGGGGSSSGSDGSWMGGGFTGGGGGDFGGGGASGDW